MTPLPTPGTVDRLTWFIAVVKPLPFQRERALTNLDRQGFVPVLPMCRELVVKDGKAQPNERPYYGRYLFVGSDRGCAGIDGTFGVQYLQRDVRAVPLVIRADAVNAIVARLEAEGGVIDLCPKPRAKGVSLFEPGTQVRLTGGPFEGHAGLFDADEGTRVRVLVSVFGRPTPTYVEPGKLVAV